MSPHDLLILRQPQDTWADAKGWGFRWSRSARPDPEHEREEQQRTKGVATAPPRTAFRRLIGLALEEVVHRVAKGVFNSPNCSKDADMTALPRLKVVLEPEGFRAWLLGTSGSEGPR